MSNVAPERMPDPLPQTPPAEPVEAQDIKASEEAYAKADAEADHAAVKRSAKRK